MKEQRDKLRAAQGAVQATQDKLTSMNTQAEALRKSLADLRLSAAEKSAAKNQWLDRFVAGDATQTDVDRARDASDRAEKALRDAEDLLKATERVISETILNLPRIANNALVKERELWLAIFEAEREAIVSAVGDRLWRAYIARMKSGGGAWNMNFFAEVFGSFYLDRVQALGVEMEKEILASQ